MTNKQVERILGEQPKEWIIEARRLEPGKTEEGPIFLEKLGNRFEGSGSGVAWTTGKSHARRFQDKKLAQAIVDNLVRAKDLPLYPVVFLTEVAPNE